MAELLRVSGIPVPVLDGEASHKPISIGDVERAEDGTKLISRRAIKESLKIRVVHQSPSDGMAWKKLFSGEGQTWNFETSLYGSKGTGPSAATAATQDGTSPKFGGGVCRLGSSTGTVSFAALPANVAKWTVMVWRKIGAGAWVHYITTSTLKAAGDAYEDGVLNASSPTSWLTVTTATGTVKLDADAASNTYIDDLVILPFEIPASWAAAVFSYGAAFSLLGKLDVDGDLVNANVGTMTVCAEVMGVDVVPGTLDGVYNQANRVIDVELEEG